MLTSLDPDLRDSTRHMYSPSPPHPSYLPSLIELVIIIPVKVVYALSVSYIN